MNNLRNVTRRLEEEMANAEVPPYGDQVPPHVKDFNDDPAPIDQPPLTDGALRDALF